MQDSRSQRVGMLVVRLRVGFTHAKGTRYVQHHLVIHQVPPQAVGQSPSNFPASAPILTRYSHRAHLIYPRLRMRHFGYLGTIMQVIHIGIPPFVAVRAARTVMPRSLAARELA